MDNSNLKGRFSDKLFYSAHFMDLSLWQPFVRLVCERHGFGCGRVFPGLPGSFPTFIVESGASGDKKSSGSVVVKFFGPLYEGADSFRIERAVGKWLDQQSLPVRSPTILAEGQLAPEWGYLFFEAIPGESIGQVRDQLSADAWVGVARQMGEFMKKLHTLPAPILYTSTPATIHPDASPSWAEFAGYLEDQRTHCQDNHRRWNDLPPHLLEQVPGFIPPVDQLVDPSSQPHLIHADLTSDHLLGRLAPAINLPTNAAHSPHTAGGDWHTLAIIDWGDARLGNILYELVALHLDLFQADNHLLQECLESYGLPYFYQSDFPRKALGMVLLHQFPMPARVYEPHWDTPTLYELADRLFALQG